MDANSPGSTTHQGGRGGSAAASRGHRVVGLVTSLALVFGLTVFMPQQASADPAQPPPATEPAVDPASPSLLSDDTSRPVVRILRLPDSSTVVVLPADEARARIDEALKELEAQVEQARRVEEQRQAQQAQAQQQVQQQVIRQQQQVQEQAQAISEVEAAQAEADARLQEALAALAKALSTSQCTTVGGTNGTQASISCPMADGSEATVSGDDNVQVVVPTPSPAPSRLCRARPTPTNMGRVV